MTGQGLGDIVNDKIKILAVDDVEVNLAMLEFMLADLGCDLSEGGQWSTGTRPPEA